MATSVITSSNRNSAPFRAAVAPSGAGHTLDLSALAKSFSTGADQASGSTTLSDGMTTFILGQACVWGTSATLGGATLLDYFTSISGAQGSDTVTGTTGDDLLGGGACDQLGQFDCEWIDNGDAMPDFADEARLCGTPCGYTSAKTNKTTIAGPSVAASRSMNASGIHNKKATWNSVPANTAAPLIHAGTAKATSVPAHDDEA